MQTTPFTTPSVPSSPIPRVVASQDGDEVLTFLETAADTHGARTYLEADIAPGVATPVHRHTTFTETFEVVEGTLAVTVRGETLQLGPGDVATVPIGAGHRFANTSDARVRFRCSLEPASRGFEEAQQLVAGFAADGLARGPLPKDPRYIGLLVDLMDTSFAGPMRALNPLFRFLGLLGRRDLDTLRNRYVRW